MSDRRFQNQFGKQRGFTIVEFMIATTVFSIVLMIVTFSIVHISKIYQRSINVSRTQAVARNIIEDISQTLQYSGGELGKKTAGSTTARCISGTRQYLYILGARREAETNSVMTARNIKDSDCTPVDIQTTHVGQQLVPVNMRVANLYVDRLGTSDSLYQVSVKIVYGDDTVLDNPSLPSASCKPGVGSEFCAISELTTTVQRRL